MKKNMIKLAAGAAAVLLMATSAHAGYTMKQKVGDVDTKLTFFGFAQLEAVGGDGMKLKEAGTLDTGSDVAFRAQRIRLGWKYVAGKVRGKVLMDFNQNADANAVGSDATDGASTPKYIKDAFISYVADPAFVIKAGLIKMPNGMGFTMSGSNLDIAERGFDKSLVIERSTGLMISGRGIGYAGNKVDGFETGHERPWKGFGYDVMVANQASRSGAASSTEFGGLSYAVRGMFDYTETIHVEASYAMSENADGKLYSDSNASLVSSHEDYSNVNVGVDSNLGKLSLKAEYTTAYNLKGIKDYDEDTYTATAAYFVMPQLELVAKHIQGSATKSNVDTDLGNTYLGFNLFLSMPYSDYSRKAKRARNQHKVVVNYILASGDTHGSTTEWNGLSGYKDDAFIVQYQFKF